MCENRLLRRMLGPERVEGKCRKPRNEGLHFYSLKSIMIKKNNEHETGGTYSRHGFNEKCMQTLVGNAGGKSSPARPKHGWKDNIKIYLEEILYSLIKSRKMRWTGHEARIGAKRNAYRILVGKPEGKRPLGRPRRRRVDDIKMYLREVG
jgi:hypothetical protein